MNKNKYNLSFIILILFVSAAILYGCGGGPSNASSTIPSSLTTPNYPKITPSPLPTEQTTPTPSPTSSQSGERDVSLYALIIGIAKYPYPNALNYSDTDGQNFYNSLKQSPLWSNAYAVTLYNSDATKANIQKYMENAASRLKENGMFVFFYSGHGTNAGGLGYIVPIDGINTFSNRINENDMQNWLSAFPSTSKKYVAIDACYSGLFIDKSLYYKKYYGLTQKFVEVEGSSYNFKGDVISKSIAAIPNMVAVMASAGGEYSYETSDLKSGVMTYYLVQGFGAGASLGPADLNGNGEITAQECYTYATPRARDYMAGRNANQNMQMKDNYTSGLVMKNR